MMKSRLLPTAQSTRTPLIRTTLVMMFAIQILSACSESNYTPVPQATTGIRPAATITPVVPNPTPGYIPNSPYANPYNTPCTFPNPCAAPITNTNTYRSSGPQYILEDYAYLAQQRAGNCVPVRMTTRSVVAATSCSPVRIELQKVYSPQKCSSCNNSCPRSACMVSAYVLVKSDAESPAAPETKVDNTPINVFALETGTLARSEPAKPEVKPEVKPAVQPETPTTPPASVKPSTPDCSSLGDAKIYSIIGQDAREIYQRLSLTKSSDGTRVGKNISCTYTKGLLNPYSCQYVILFKDVVDTAHPENSLHIGDLKNLSPVSEPGMSDINTNPAYLGGTNVKILGGLSKNAIISNAQAECILKKLPGDSLTPMVVDAAGTLKAEGKIGGALKCYRTLESTSADGKKIPSDTRCEIQMEVFRGEALPASFQAYY